MTHNHTCTTCGHEFDVQLFPAEPATRTDPGFAATCEPPDCPECGAEIDVDDLTEALASEHEAGIEERAEAKREIAQ